MAAPATASEVRVSGGPYTQTPSAPTQTATAARRTEGVNPVTPTSTNASNEPNLPTEGASRIPFAPNEQTRNADNYDAAVALLGAGGDKFGTRLWWDVKTDKPAW